MVDGVNVVLNDILDNSRSNNALPQLVQVINDSDAFAFFCGILEAHISEKAILRSSQPVKLRCGPLLRETNNKAISMLFRLIDNKVMDFLDSSESDWYVWGKSNFKK
jgi:hypothetical protein